ncbi:MAG: alpha-amylase [Acidimicrobiia bacterium]|nr:alpha-amylase [Actinomycetota bacterium]MBL6927175.1 alpha-amylase [Acidimicrobiia bacterium]
MPQQAVGSRTAVSSSIDARPWWHDRVGYEIYIRSFADSDGDGIGDLAGVTDKLDYLSDLGIDFIWVTPFYPSPMADWGYDVADFCGVDPAFGSLGDLDRLVEEAHGRSMRVVIDIVPNHTSHRHAWFREALADPNGPFRDYYIWRDPAPDGGPPNNWVGYFGGPAWTLDEASGQYYLHLFLPEQPDLNWRNPAVHEEFDGIIRFWLDRGVDGFRIDVAGGLVKDADLRSNPEIGVWDPAGTRWEQWEAFEHLFDVFQPESLEIFRRWRAIVDEYGAWLMGETYTLEPEGLARLVPGDGLHSGFWFEPMHIDWDVDQIRKALVPPAELLGDRLLWAASSHDMPRSPTHFGGGDQGRARTLALNVLFLCLPGVPVLYQGEELGLVDGTVSPSAKLDPVGPDGDVAAGRDGCRTPMPWRPGETNGFTDGTPWLSSSQRDGHETAEVQAVDAGSWYDQYRSLLAAKREIGPLTGEAVQWDDDGVGPVIRYRRGPVSVAANVSDGPVTVYVGDSAGLVFKTVGVVHVDGRVELPAHGAAIWM